MIVREDETGEMVAAAMWGFYPEDVKVGGDAPTEVEPKEVGERERIFSREGGLAAIGRTSKAFKDKFVQGRAHACKIFPTLFRVVLLTNTTQISTFLSRIPRIKERAPAACSYNGAATGLTRKD